MESLVKLLFEVILRGILGGLLYLGRLVGGPVVTWLSGGQVLLDPPGNDLVVLRYWHGVHRLTDGTPVLGKKLTGLLGLALLAPAVFILVAALL